MEIAVRMKARDRRLAAVHEAGHVVMARHFGLKKTRASIWPTGSGSVDEKHWVGHCCFYDKKILRLSHFRRCMIAVAGTVAERAWLGEQCCWWEYFSESEVMSESDWKDTGYTSEEFDRKFIRAVERASDLLYRGGELWEPLCNMSRDLIQSYKFEKWLLG